MRRIPLPAHPGTAAIVAGIVAGAVTVAVAAPLIARRWDAKPADGFNGFGEAMEVVLVAFLAALAGAAAGAGLAAVRHPDAVLRSPRTWVAVAIWSVLILPLAAIVTLVAAVVGGPVLGVPAALIGPGLVVRAAVGLGAGTIPPERPVSGPPTP